MRLPLPRRADEDDLDPADAAPAPAHPVSATLDAAPDLSAAMAESVRFTVTEPQGYYFEQVEAFVAQAHDALRFWEERDFQHRQREYDLEHELALQVADVQRLRTEIELFTVQGSPVTNADGSYVTESQVQAQPQAQAQAQDLAAQLAAAEAARAQTEADLIALRAWADEVEPQIQVFTQMIAERDAALAEAQQTIVERDAALAEAQRALAALRAEQDAQVAAQSTAPAAVQPVPLAEPLPDREGLPAVEEAADGLLHVGDGDADPSPLPLIDSELPPGVTLPPAQAPDPYPAAAPGAPLSTVRGPVEQWAPELAVEDGAA